MNVKRLQRRIMELLSTPRSIQQLLHSLQIPERTLRYHLAILRRQNLVQETFLFSDRRRKLLTVSKKFKKLDYSSVLSDFGSVKDYISECSAW